MLTIPPHGFFCYHERKSGDFMEGYISKNCTLYDRFVVGFFYFLGFITFTISIKALPEIPLWQTTLYLFLLTLFAIFIVDLLTGIVHFLLDYHDLGPLKVYLKKNLKSVDEINVFARKKASIFQELAFDFQLHHRLPDSILDASFKTMALRIIYILFPIYLAIFLLFQLNFIHPYALFFLSQIIVIGSFCHYTHQWAHNKKPIFLIKILQKTRFAITPEQHEIHHKNYLKNFCSFTGWSNFLVNYLFQKFYLIYRHKHS